MDIKDKSKQKPIFKDRKYFPIRLLISALFIIFEVVLVIALIMFLCYKEKYFYIGAIIAEAYCVIKIIASDDNPEYKAPWLFLVLVFPIVGFMLYFIFYSRQLGSKYVKRLKEIAEGFYEKDDSLILEKLKSEDVVAFSQAKMLTTVADTRVFTGVNQRYFSSGEQMKESLLDDLKKAEKFIYLEFFIIHFGTFWNDIFEILKQKAEQGVEVKLIYDDFGCMGKIPMNFIKKLKKYRIDATAFSYIKPPASSELNNRTHRKMIIIDGYIGYTGGVNIGDEYINLKSPYGYWKDSAIRLEGEAVWEFTELFLTDFGVNVKHLPPARQDLYPKVSFDNEGGYVVPFGDGPTPIYWRRVTKSALNNMIDSATKYCYITTPYLIPDSDLCLSLENASLKGVDVRIFVPHIPDKKAVFAITKSYYYRLMKAGVKIYEFTPGFIHAKSCLVDGVSAIVGTANLDYRSLAHNFENGVWLYKTECIKDIKADFDNLTSQSLLMNGKKTKPNPFYKLFSALIRIFAPLM